MNQRRASLALAAALTFALAAGCHKKQAPPPPPPPPTQAPPEAAKPVINYFSAEPTAVDKGQPSSLRWSVTDATNVTIDNNVGEVSPSGRRAVYPTDTTTYTLTATGAGGTATSSVTVSINTPPPPPAVAPPPSETVADIISKRVKDVHFGYDKSDVLPEDEPILQSDAAALKQIFQMDPNFVVTLEGHCDERGSAEYNLALGDRRAAAVKDALTQQGIPADKLKTISYGKERPLCTDETEECYARNRRVHFSANQ